MKPPLCTFSSFPQSALMSLLSVNVSSASEIFSLWIFVLLLLGQQVLIVQWCVQTVWRTGTVTPKTPTTWATSLDLWLARSTSGRTASLQPTLTVTHWSSRTQSYTKPICAMGHPTASKRTYKETHFPINTICYILIEKVRPWRTVGTVNSKFFIPRSTL